MTSAGCARHWPRILVGVGPSNFGVSTRENTLYTYTGDSHTISFLNLRRPCRPHLCVR